MTESNSNIEKLAGVPEGTIAKLKIYAALHPELDNPSDDEEGYWKSYDAYAQMPNDLKTIRDFFSFGLGHLRYGDLKKILRTESESEIAVGQTTDINLVNQLLKAAGSEVDPQLCEGVYWG